VLALYVAQFQVDRREGPDQSGDFSVDPKAFLILLLAGFVVGTLGHIYKSKTMVATGILMIFLATVGIPLYLNLTR